MKKTYWKMGLLFVVLAGTTCYLEACTNPAPTVAVQEKAIVSHCNDSRYACIACCEATWHSFDGIWYDGECHGCAVDQGTMTPGECQTVCQELNCGSGNITSTLSGSGTEGGSDDGSGSGTGQCSCDNCPL